VELVVRNGLREHAVRFDATPPPGWGDRFSVRGRFTQPLLARRGDWRRWSGTAYAELPRADVHALRQHVDLPFELSEGDGALRGWFDVDAGQPRSATVDLALRAVTLRLDPKVDPLSFEQVEGRFSVDRRDDRISVAARRFGFVTGDGVRWPLGNVDVAWRQREGGEVSGGELDADRLDLGVIAGVATRLPLGASLRELLADVRPQGILTGLATRWEGPLDAPERYRIKGLLSGLTLEPRPGPRADAVGRPGLRNANVQLDATESGGTARIGMRDGRLELPGVFDDPSLPIDTLDAGLRWSIRHAGADKAAPASVEVKVEQAHFANADARGELKATWRTGRDAPGAGGGGRYPGDLELDGTLFDASALRTARYLPLGLPEGVRSYLARAVRGGVIPKSTFRVRGDLHAFPFHDARSARDGEFRIAAQFADVTFAYAPDAPASAPDASVPATDRAAPLWPPVTAASGEVVVDRSVVELRNVQGRLGGVAWTGVHGHIAEAGGRPQLELEGGGRGALADMLRFVETTPVGRWTGRVLAGASGSGQAELKIALGIPLDDAAGSTRVRGSLLLAGNDVRITPDTPLLGSAKARIDFTQKGFTVGSASARMLGGDVRFEGGSQGEAAQRFNAQGTFSAEGLRQAPELGTPARLASVLSGQGSYTATLAFIHGHPQIELASSLVGIAVDLPAPLGKPAATALPLRVRTALDNPSAATADPAAPLRDMLQVELTGVLQARFVRESAGDSSRVVRGAIRLTDPAPAAATAGAAAPSGSAAAAAGLALPAAGVAAEVDLRRLDVDAWRAAATRLGGVPAPAAKGGAAPAPPLVFDAAGGAGYVPTAVALRVDAVEAGSRRLGHVTAGLSQEGGLWRANVDSDELDGYIEYRPARDGAGRAGRVYARLSRLSLPKGEAEHVETLLDEQPATLPALDIVVDEFELRGKRLGRLEIAASNRAADAQPAGAREWRLSKLNLTMPEARFTASGTWGTPGGAGAVPQTRLDMTLVLADSGALLERLGLGKVVKGGKGSLAGQVSWPGSPLSPDYARMSGQVKVAIDAGQFLKAGPGAGRLLSVLSLQSLPRRLLFDFRDLFAEGFVFDNAVGDVTIAGGVASTNNLRMRGTAAAVLMEGSADLEHETEDLRVIVVPEINAGTASLAYAIINPAVGLGTFLAQYFLRKPLMAASTREFRVTGPWDDPKVERVERSLFGGTEPATAKPEASDASADAPLAAEPRPVTTR
ncbi:MAG: YhdP family protein, partial [Caldimonas sp.]